MTTYILGAGASSDSGYPLAREMEADLFSWMENRSEFRDVSSDLRQWFHLTGDIGDLIENIDLAIATGSKQGVSEEDRSRATSLANGQKPAVLEALRQRFNEIRTLPAQTYNSFAKNICQPGDCVITFNYDVSVDRELQLAGKWHLGDGYGFEVDGFDGSSPVKLLKLHGSMNWLIPIFGGRTRGGGSFRIGEVFGPRPIFNDSELTFLGYSEKTDIQFPRAGATGLLSLVLPIRSKQFFFGTSLGPEFGQFWNNLWASAAVALANSKRVVIAGYSLPIVDERACEMIFSNSHGAQIEVCSGGQSEEIARRFAEHGLFASVSDDPHFKEWVSNWSQR